MGVFWWRTHVRHGEGVAGCGQFFFADIAPIGTVSVSQKVPNEGIDITGDR